VVLFVLNFIYVDIVIKIEVSDNKENNDSKISQISINGKTGNKSMTAKIPQYTV
jgi:hypothetical protein